MSSAGVAVRKGFQMANSLVHDLVEAGIHFGQRSSGWNPKMQPYIYGKRSGIHIIDIKETVKGLLLAKKFIAKTVADGKDVCFVGTKRQARAVIEQRVGDAKMHYVTERWLGGTLTNFRTIRSRLKRLEELEAIEKNDNFASYSKKMESQLKREKDKIFTNLSGIRAMDKLPGALIVIDVNKEINALREAKKLGIPTICLVDTDGDPDMVDIPIPGNDDSMRSIDVIVRELCLAVADGKQLRTQVKEQSSASGGEGGEGRGPRGDGAGGDRNRRSSRAKYRADDASGAPAGEDRPAPAAAAA
ncbi:MAG: 30S ribosomal protein S2, partial [Phycisphaerales bacterium]|nr:30S ribosomal protein S2 [Phycisphaerales bacterium]